MGNVTAAMLSGNRIGVIQGGTLYVKEGGLGAQWIAEMGNATDGVLTAG